LKNPIKEKEKDVKEDAIFALINEAIQVTI